MTNDKSQTSEHSIPTLLTIGQVAEQLLISTKTVRRWIKSGDLIAHRIGRQLRISRTDLENFIRMRRAV